MDRNTLKKFGVLLMLTKGTGGALGLVALLLLRHG
jgi:hypothetical protein